jgi:integrase
MVAFPEAYGRTDQTRVAYAIELSKTLQRRRDEIAAGALPARGVLYATAVEMYLAARPRMSPRSRRLYELHYSERIGAWLKRADVRTLDDIKRSTLLALREHIETRGKLLGWKERAESKELRRETTVNSDFKRLRALFGYFLERELLPKVRLEDLKLAFKPLAIVSEPIEFLKAPAIRQLLEAIIAHDRDPANYDPLGPYVMILLLTGMRPAAASELDWPSIDLDSNLVTPRGASAANKRLGMIDLTVAPMLRALLEATPKERRTGRVLPPMYGTQHLADRLRENFDLPEGFQWRKLRRTCGTFLTNSPGLFAGASAYRSAKWLGHSVTIAEKHYLGIVRVSPEAKTLEAAMGVEDLLAKIVEAEKRRQRARR